MMADFRLPVLGYHAVGDQRPGLESHLVLPEREFHQHLDWLLALGYRTVRLEDIVAAFDGTDSLPPRPVLLTFDDGYAELASTAFPALEARGMTASVFVVTRHLGGSNVWDNAPGGPSVPLLTSADVKSWHGKGIQFGAHTRTHPRLSQLQPDAAAREISGSADDLAAIIGERIRAFAYPYGDADPTAARIVANTFRLGFSSWRGLNSRTTRPSMLRRTMVAPGTNWLTLRCHLEFGRLPWESFGPLLAPGGLKRFLERRRDSR